MIYDLDRRQLDAGKIDAEIQHGWHTSVYNTYGVTGLRYIRMSN